MLVTEPRKEVRHDDFFYWLNIIKLLGGDSPVLLVQNKSDQPLEDIPFREYKKLFDNITDNLQRTSCQTDRKDTIRDLQKVIAKLICDRELLPHVGEELPRVWVNIREELSNLETPYITYQEYLDICKNHNMDQRRAGFLAEFFHDLGVFLHFKDNPQLRKTTFLSNRWVTQGVYRILDDEQMIENKGEFSLDDLDRCWKDTNYVGWEADFIELMKEFNICYPLRDKKNHYLAPHRLPKDEPENLPWDDKDNLHFEYHYEFMPKGILANFIVRQYKNICEQYQWRYGVLLEVNNTFALVKEDYFNRKIIIRLRGEDRRDALGQIRGTFEDIHSKFSDFSVSEMVPCNCSECKKDKEPYFYSYKVLQKHLKKSEYKITCNKSIEKVEIANLIEAIISPNRRSSGEHDKENRFEQDNNQNLDEAALLKIAQELTRVQILPRVPTIKILFLAANPKDTTNLRIDEETRDIRQALRKTKYRDEFVFHPHLAVRVSDIQEHFLEYEPDIVHFSGHGSQSGALYFENDLGNSQGVRDVEEKRERLPTNSSTSPLKPLEESALANLFDIFKDSVKCVVLNACYTEMQAHAIRKHIPCVVGMSSAIDDDSAIAFAKSFYQGLGYGKDVETAFKLGTNQLGLSKLKDKDTPKILGNYDFSTHLRKESTKTLTGITHPLKSLSQTKYSCIYLSKDVCRNDLFS